MAPVPITPDQLSALERAGEPCIRLVDPTTRKVYVLMEQGVEPEIEESHLRYMREGLEAARAEAACGGERPWDIAAAVQRGKELLAERRGAPGCGG